MECYLKERVDPKVLPFTMCELDELGYEMKNRILATIQAVSEDDNLFEEYREEISQEAWNDGYEEGFKDGKNDG